MLFGGMVIRGLVEVAGVASIMPFVGVVSNPEIIHTNKYLSYTYDFLGVSSDKSFLLILGLIVFAVILINNILSALTDWYLFHYTWMRSYALSKRLFAKYLSWPYSRFLTTNTSELGANILNEVSNFMKGILQPFMEMTAKSIICVFIFTLLLSIDIMLALVVGSVLGCAYMAIFIFVRKKLIIIGEQRVYNNKKQFRYISEGFNGIKDIKAKGCEAFFLNGFSHHAKNVNRYRASHQIISQLPKYALEVVAFGGILLIMLYFVLTDKNTSETIPLIALYAFAGYRLMPALQKIFVGITSIKFNVALLEKLTEDLETLTPKLSMSAITQRREQPIRFESQLVLNNITYSYPGSTEKVLNSLDLSIEAGSTVGFVGTTGAGKSTLIDIILGLLVAEKGSIMADKVKLDQENLMNWLANIGYVPQQIFLADQSVKENIALGIPVDEIDELAVTRAAKVANLHDFICNELKDTYDTVVGERGTRLSGGQRQRIGIARALYHNPDFLILDEATSALDNFTEKKVIEAINKLTGRKTIIMIAHRLSTLENCDVIHFFSKGNVTHSGTYTELKEQCQEFLKMVRAGEMK